jgi:hypothetical protein
MWLSGAVAQAGEDPWIAFTAIATGASAIATLVSAVFIAVQAWFTRRSVQETSSALKVAQREFEQNSQVFIDAQKARIDAEMPRLSVTVFDVRMQTTGSNPTVLNAGASYDDSANLNQRLAMIISVSVSNDGPRVANIDVSSEVGTLLDPIIAVGVGKRVSFSLTLAYPLRRWMELARIVHGFEGVPDDTRTLQDLVELVYRFPGDTGADEHQIVAMRGSMLHPIDGIDFEVAAVSINSNNDFWLMARPFTRVYWQSRAEDRLL